jgi:magnesium-transporting ATPase (P-type)
MSLQFLYTHTHTHTHTHSRKRQRKKTCGCQLLQEAYRLYCSTTLLQALRLSETSGCQQESSRLQATTIYVSLSIYVSLYYCVCVLMYYQWLSASKASSRLQATTICFIIYICVLILLCMCPYILPVVVSKNQVASWLYCFTTLLQASSCTTSGYQQESSRLRGSSSCSRES